jgi:hypothetical protein
MLLMADKASRAKVALLIWMRNQRSYYIRVPDCPKECSICAIRSCMLRNQRERSTRWTMT